MLRFRETDHTYWLREARLPSVSEIIAPLNPFQGGAVPADILEAARWRGSAVHMACRLDDENDLDEESVCATVRPYLAAWRSFKKHRVGDLLTNENAMASSVYHYAGTPDRIARLSSQHLAILDLKTGPPHPVYAIQLSAYAQLAVEHFDDLRKPIKRFAVQLSRNAEFRLHEYKGAGDFGVFAACLKLWRWRSRYGKAG